LILLPFSLRSTMWHACVCITRTAQSKSFPWTESPMCGIAGMIGQRTQDETTPLKSLAHRGPDDSGWIAHGAHTTAPRFHSVLLHRRLSILDLSAAGHQPMASQAGGYTIVFNGEIYNYRELRDELRG